VFNISFGGCTGLLNAFATPTFVPKVMGALGQSLQQQAACHPSPAELAHSGIVDFTLAQGSATAGATAGDAFGTFSTAGGYGGIFHTRFEGAFYGEPSFGTAYGTGKSQSLATFQGKNNNLIATLGPYSISDSFDINKVFNHVGYSDELSTWGLGIGLTRSNTTILLTKCPGQH